MQSLESVLQDLVDRTSPGVVRLNVPRAAWMREYASYEVSIQTRSCDEIFTGKTLAIAIRWAAEEMAQPRAEGDRDPVVPSWYRVSRMQREIVQRTRERYRAKHMANAASANIAHATATAEAEYAMADAFKAALDVLDYEEHDEDQGPLEKEVLASRDEESKIVAKSRAVERGEQVPSKGRKARVAATVKELREKNRAKAASHAKGPASGPDRS